jgi:DNA-binding CsgD family transcriptional regulator
MSPPDVANLRCSAHPGAPVRRYRSHGPRGPGVYPQCMPPAGQPHLLRWEDAIGVHVVAHAPVDPIGCGLSRAELDVLQAAARGLTVPESAALLGKGRETVKTQRHQIILKLGARNVAHAVAIATTRGVMQIDEPTSRNAA